MPFAIIVKSAGNDLVVSSGVILITKLILHTNKSVNNFWMCQHISAYQSRPSPECSWPLLYYMLNYSCNEWFAWYIHPKPKGWGCTYQANHSFSCYNCYVPWPLLLASIKQLMKNNWIPQMKGYNFDYKSSWVISMYHCKAKP